MGREQTKPYEKGDTLNLFERKNDLLHRYDADDTPGMLIRETTLHAFDMKREERHAGLSTGKKHPHRWPICRGNNSANDLSAVKE